MRGEQKVGVQRGENALTFAPCRRLDAGRIVARDPYAMDA